MNTSAYILEYLKQFGTVTVPDFGVFYLENSKAVINSENGSILPPSGQIAFDFDFDIKSDELAEFISHQKQASLESVKRDLVIQTDFWKKKLRSEFGVNIQNLGMLYIEDGKFHFNGYRLESGHPDFYGLEEIKISEISNAETVKSADAEKDYIFNKSVLWAFLIVIPVLGLVFLAFTQQELLFGKKSFSVQTKTHRIPEKEVKTKENTPPAAILDTLKKDSLKQAGKAVKKPGDKQY